MKNNKKWAQAAAMAQTSLQALQGPYLELHYQPSRFF